MNGGTRAVTRGVTKSVAGLGGPAAAPPHAGTRTSPEPPVIRATPHAAACKGGLGSCRIPSTGGRRTPSSGRRHTAVASPCQEEREGVGERGEENGSRRKGRWRPRSPASRRSPIPRPPIDPPPKASAAPARQPPPLPPPLLHAASRLPPCPPPGRRMMLPNLPSPSRVLMLLVTALPVATSSPIRTQPPGRTSQTSPACCRARKARAVPPTATVSVTADRSRKGASAGRAYCEAAMARPRPRQLRQRGTRVRAPPRRDLALGRAPATPA